MMQASCRAWRDDPDKFFKTYAEKGIIGIIIQNNTGVSDFANNGVTFPTISSRRQANKS